MSKRKCPTATQGACSLGCTLIGLWWTKASQGYGSLQLGEWLECTYWTVQREWKISLPKVMEEAGLSGCSDAVFIALCKNKRYYLKEAGRAQTKGDMISFRVYGAQVLPVHVQDHMLWISWDTCSLHQVGHYYPGIIARSRSYVGSQGTRLPA